MYVIVILLLYVNWLGLGKLLQRQPITDGNVCIHVCTFSLKRCPVVRHLNELDWNLFIYEGTPWFMTLFWNLEKVRKFIDDCSSCIAPSFHMCWTKSWRVTLYSHPINGLLPSLVVENFSKKTLGSHLSWFATTQLTIHPINFRRQSRSGGPVTAKGRVQ